MTEIAPYVRKGTTSIPASRNCISANCKNSNQHSCLTRFPFLTGYSLETRRENKRKIFGGNVQEKTCEKMEGFKTKRLFLSKFL